ncbi:MAG: hypothetical protein Q7R95_06305 [bacterium]|nr:hypothetical protein [bacterium]
MSKWGGEKSTPKIPDRLTGSKIEVGGVEVKFIGSNIRRSDIPWDSLQLMTGIGKEGNLVVVEAMSDDGFRIAVENQQGRDVRVCKSDRFVSVLANRHSGTSESGDVPPEGIDIQEDTELHLLSAGAVVGIITGMPSRAGKNPMFLKTLGLVAKDGKPLDLIELCEPHHEKLNPSAPIIMVCGTSAEVGKTTTSVGIIRALNNGNTKVAGTKFSGTGRMRDILALRDAGAFPWLDFPDVGLATTYTSPKRYIKGMYTLFNLINEGKPNIIIAEAGGDPIEANIPTFLANNEFMKNVIAIVIVAGDVMGMMGTVNYLKKFKFKIPFFLTDPKDRNSFTTRDRVRQFLPGIPIFNSLDPEETRKAVEQMLAYRK